MAQIQDFSKIIAEFKRRLSKIEATRKSIGADVFTVVQSDEIEVNETLTSGQKLNLLANFFPSDEYLHLLHVLWSVGVGVRGEIALNINYTGGTILDSKDVLTGGNFDLTQQFRRSIVEASNGILFVVYIDTSAGSGNYDLMFRISLDQGATWSSATKIADLTYVAGDVVNNYDLFIDASNNIHVVWDDKSGGFGIVKYVKLTFASNNWSVGTIKNVAGGTTSERCSQGSVVMQTSGRVFIGMNIRNGTNEGIIVRFTDTGGDIFRDIDLNIGGPGGDPGELPFNLSSQTSSGKYHSLVLRNNIPFVVWHDFSNGLMYHSIWTGTQWDSYENGTFGVSPHVSFHNPTGNVTTDWSMGVDVSFNIHLAIYDGNGNSIEYLNYNGTNWTTEELINEGVRDHSVSITSDSDEQFLFYVYKATNDGLTRGPLRKRARTSSIWQAGSSVITAEPLPFTRIHTPERFRTDTFKYCLFVIGSFSLPGVNDKLKIYRETIGGQTDIKLAVAQTSDDGTETNDSSWNDLVVKVGEQSGAANSFDAGLRFTGVTIPQGATINSAVLSLIGNETSVSEIVNTTIKGIKEANTLTFSSSSRPSQRTKTTANVSWAIPNRTINVVQNSPDLSTIIQEIVNQATWVSGNALALVLEDNANTDKDAVFVDFTEQVIREWYEANDVSIQHWKDWANSSDNIGKRSFYWVIKNLTAESISVRIRFKGYATWQNQLIRT